MKWEIENRKTERWKKIRKKERLSRIKLSKLLNTIIILLKRNWKNLKEEKEKEKGIHDTSTFLHGIIYRARQNKLFPYVNNCQYRNVINHTIQYDIIPSSYNWDLSGNLVTLKWFTHFFIDNFIFEC